MPGELTLRVITPDRIALDTIAEHVVLPASDGAMGVLPRHAPMVTALEPGLLKYRGHGGMDVVLFVSAGFAEVRDDTVRIVTQAGERPDEIDEARARAAEKRARERIAEGMRPGGEPIDILRAEHSLRRAVQRLRAKDID
jgi:F-type H+-transporting ATPase subunit epsilon